MTAPQYLNRQMAPLVNELKYKRVLEESIRRLEQNVKARERYLGAGRVFSCGQHPAGHQRDSGAFVGRVSLIAARGVTGHTCWFRQAERSRAKKGTPSTDVPFYMGDMKTDLYISPLCQVISVC